MTEENYWKEKYADVHIRLTNRIAILEQENKELKKQNEILLGQLVINDGEDVTVQISQSQFDEYNDLKQENKELKEKVEVLDKMTGIFSARLCDKYRSALEEIRILATKNVSIENFVKIQNKINEVLNHSEG